MSEEQLSAQFDEWAKSYVAEDPKHNWNLIGGHDSEDLYAFLGFEACAKINDAKYAKLRELAEKVAGAGYYTHPLATAMDELRNYLKEVK